MSAPGYANLLAHLHRPSSLPLPTLQSALAHHLAKLSPLPTPLAAIIVSSPLFCAPPFSHQKLQALFTAFRHATHLKFRDAIEREGNQSVVSAAFTWGTSTRVKHWADAVLKGIKGGQPLLRLACCGGLLAGLEDLQMAEHLDIARSKLEDEVVIAVAESMDMYSSSDGWESEFRPAGDVDTMTLALILASQSLVSVAPGKLKALPLSTLLELLNLAVAATFASGTFLATAFTPHDFTLRAINESPLMECIAPLSKLTALVTRVLCEHRPAEGIASASASLEALRLVSKTLESDWTASFMARRADPQEEMTLVWTTLKTLLFANIMIADAALSAVVYIPPAAYSGSSKTPSALALTVLHTLYNLSFVVSQFGGVATTASPGFVELKKTFYLALDILAKSPDESDRFVRELCVSIQDLRSRRSDEDSDILAKTAYALTCSEQLVPALGGECIQTYALPLAMPHLSDPSHRETYESSHSMVLAIFASHANQKAVGLSDNAESAQGAGFTERMVPFYAQCLIENSVDGRLSTPQLRLAFTSLVKGASASGAQSGVAGDLVDGGEYALAWYCIEVLLDAIRAAPDSDTDRLHRLNLTLISTVPSLPLPLLSRVLEEVRSAILTTAARGGAGNSKAEAKDLVDATFVELSERVGDREKEFVMRWWYDRRAAFLAAGVLPVSSRAAQDGLQGQAHL